MVNTLLKNYVHGNALSKKKKKKNDDDTMSVYVYL